MQKNFLIAIFILLAQNLWSQQYYNDSALVSGASDHVKRSYIEKRGNLLAIFNGKLHNSYLSTIEGTAYFLSDSFQTGTLVYENIFYENIVMNYDLVLDQLIVAENRSTGIPISLFSPRVKEFSYSGLIFFYLNDTDPLAAHLPMGFYQQLASGKARAISRSTKMIIETPGDNTVLRRFEQTKRYYIIKEGQLYHIKKKKDLLNTLKDQRKGIQEFMRNQKLNFKKKKEKTITAVTEFYNKTGGKKI
jgi:hypothetical protein